MTLFHGLVGLGALARPSAEPLLTRAGGDGARLHPLAQQISFQFNRRRWCQLDEHRGSQQRPGGRARRNWRRPAVARDCRRLAVPKAMLACDVAKARRLLLCDPPSDAGRAVVMLMWAGTAPLPRPPSAGIIPPRPLAIRRGTRFRHGQPWPTSGRKPVQPARRMTTTVPIGVYFAVQTLHLAESPCQTRADRADNYEIIRIRRRNP